MQCNLQVCSSPITHHKSVLQRYQPKVFSLTRVKLLFLAFVSLWVAGVWQTSKMFQLRVIRISGLMPLKGDVYTVWPTFVATPAKTHEWYQKTCFQNPFGEGLEHILTSSLREWSLATDPVCSDLFSKFSVIFEVRERISRKIEIPVLFGEKIHKWMKGNVDLIANLQQQTLIHVFNRFTSDHCIYNPLRSNRPMPTGNVDILTWIDDMATESAKYCDFCKYNELTAVDEFGRHETTHTARASNTFKIERWHGMIVTKSHHPINISKDAFFDLLHQSDSWIKDVFNLEPEYKYCGQFLTFNKTHFR